MGREGESFSDPEVTLESWFSQNTQKDILEAKSNRTAGHIVDGSPQCRQGL